MARNTRTFKDLDLNFNAHPATGDVTMKYDDEAIKQSIRSLVLTQHYERPFHPEIGSSVRGMLFDNPGPMQTNLLRRTITDVIENFEPRAQVLDIQIRYEPDQNGCDIRITFLIRNTATPVELYLTVERTR